MKIDAWLRTAIADAEERGLPELKPLLEAWLSRPGRCALRTSPPMLAALPRCPARLH